MSDNEKKLTEARALVSGWMKEFMPGESLIEGLARKICERDRSRAGSIDPDDSVHLAHLLKRWVDDVADVRSASYQERLVTRLLTCGYHRDKG